MPISDPKSGDLYVVTEPFETIVLVQFFAPFTGGSSRVLPSGLEFEIFGDPVPGAKAVAARPINAERWAREFVSSENLSDDKYGGYSLVIDRNDLAFRCAVAG